MNISFKEMITCMSVPITLGIIFSVLALIYNIPSLGWLGVMFIVIGISVPVINLILLFIKDEPF